MRKLSNLRPSPALIVAMAALVVAMSGAAIALPGKGSVGKNDIKNGAVTAKKIARGTIGSKQIKGKSIRGNRIKDGGIKAKQIADKTITAEQIEDETITAGQIADATITGAKVADETLGSDKISDYAVIASPAGSFVKLTATEAATAAEARTAAAESELFTKGEIRVTAKCFRDTTSNQITAEVYVKSTADGAIFSSDEDQKPGGNAGTDFLNPGTAETASQALVVVASAGTPAALLDGSFNAIGTDGTHLIGQLTAAAKNGELTAGNGVYGAGNVCLFGGEISG